MKICKDCGREFSLFVIVNGKEYNMGNYRKYCLECLPFIPKDMNPEDIDFDRNKFFVNSDGRARKKTELICLECNKKYFANGVGKEKRSKGKGYCSIKCASVAKESERYYYKCPVCNKDCEILPGRLKRSKSGIHFCGRECKDSVYKIGGMKEILPLQWGDKRKGENYFHLKKKDYIEISELQENKCKICNKECKLVVDHCHTLNIFRGLICASCNSGLGFFYDNPEFMENAAGYIRDFEYDKYILNDLPKREYD